MRNLYFIFIIISFIPVSNVNSEIYKYINKNGSVAYTDNLSNVPEDQRPKVNNQNQSKTPSKETRNPDEYKKWAEEQDKELNRKMLDYLKKEYGAKETCPAETETDKREAIKTTWTEMTSAMIDGNLENALSYFSMMSRDENKRKMMNLGKDELKSIYGSFEKIEIFTLNEGNAECGVIRTESTGSFSYPVRFVRDLDCIWRIQGL